MDSELARSKRMEASLFGCLHSVIIIYDFATNRSMVIFGVRYYECNKFSGVGGFRSVGCIWHVLVYWRICIWSADEMDLLS